MRLSRGASLDERRQCSDHHLHSSNPPAENSSNNCNDRHILSDNPNLEKKKMHSGDRREKSKSDRHSYYGERENGNQLKFAEYSDKKRSELFSNNLSSSVDRAVYYNENDPHSKIVNAYSDHETNVGKNENAAERFFSDTELQIENRIRRDNAKNKFFGNELAECANDARSDSTIFFEKNDPLIKLENEPKIQTRRAHFSECDNRKSFGDIDLRRSKGSLRQEHRSQRSAFSESVDSASSRSQLSNLEATTDFADKMMKSSRSYLAEGDCSRINTASSAREASDDSSPGAITQGFETLDSKYARKRARKCGHRRQKSLDIGRHATQQDLSQNEAKSFRDFDLEEDLSKRLDRLEPKSGGFIRQSVKKNLSRYDLNFDSEDERCFRHSLDMERSFDLDFLDTSIDDRYGSFERDFDLV